MLIDSVGLQDNFVTAVVSDVTDLFLKSKGHRPTPSSRGMEGGWFSFKARHGHSNSKRWICLW